MACLRPHAGANLALVLYGISYGNGIGDHKATYGYDVSGGLDFNPWNTVSFDLGVRYVKMLGIPAQLAFGTAEPIEPAYLQAYLAVGFSLPLAGPRRRRTRRHGQPRRARRSCAWRPPPRSMLERRAARRR